MARGSIVALLFFACSCGVPGMRSGPVNAGDAEVEPSMDCLPDPDVEMTSLSERMRFGWSLAEESFLLPPPSPPSDQSHASLQRWGEDELARWLERKVHTVESARRELDVAADEAHRQRIMGGAIVGLMYEDVARVLLTVPSPSELEDEPEIRDIHRAVVRGQARPFLEHARRAYSACAQNAVQPSSMRHWSRFCRRRGDRLPGAGTGELDPGPASGETTVEVMID